MLCLIPLIYSCITFFLQLIVSLNLAFHNITLLLCPIAMTSMAVHLKWNPSTLLVGMHTGAATVENSMEFPQKTKNGTAL